MTDDLDLSFLDTPERESLFTESFKYHIDHPDLTVEQHLRNKTIALGEEVARRKKVYLDTKYWIFLRDVESNGSGDPRHEEIRRLLVQLTGEGKVICPFSDYLHLELFKQRDAQTRLCTAQIIDTLSYGVSIKSSPERVELELGHFLRSLGGTRSSIRPLEHYVWTKTCYTLGSLIPVPSVPPTDQMRHFQKSFIDVLWTTTLEEMLTILSLSDRPPPEPLQDTFSSINDKKFRYADDIKSFKQACLLEFAGLLDSYKELLRRILCQYHRAVTAKEPTQGEQDESTRSFQNLLYHAFRLGKLRRQVPGLVTLAYMHGMFRWDRERKFKKNDLEDFGHAATALPYCDLLLTENSLKAFVTSKPLCLDKLYGTQVISDESEAIEALRKI